MPSVVQQLTQRGLAHPPSYLPHNTMYEVVMGSIAYGVNTDTSDFDVVGWTIPPKEVIFPHLGGEIADFGTQKKRFKVYQEHHVFDADALGGQGRTFDLNIYSIVSYLQLCMENNPNMIDSLFVPEDCVLSITHIGHMVRERRRSFLHKGAWHKFKGYAYSQLHKMNGKQHEPNSKRAALREKFGFDVKFAYHTLRLLDEVEQILVEGDIDLRRNREQLKAIRRGDVSEEDIRQIAAEKEKYLEKLYSDCKLPYGPDEEAIKQLLLDVLEAHYGDLSTAVVKQDALAVAMRQIKSIVEKVSV